METQKEEVEIMAKSTYFTIAPEGFYRVLPIGRIDYLNLAEAREKRWEKVKAAIALPILAGEYKGKRLPLYQTLGLDTGGNPYLGENTKLGDILTKLGQRWGDGSKINLKMLEREMIAEVQNSTRQGSTLRKVVELYLPAEFKAMYPEQFEAMNE